LRLRRALCGLWKPVLEVTFLASHISLQSPLSLEMGYLMFNTSSYSTTLIYSVIYSHFDQPSVDGYSVSTSHWCWIGTSRGFVMISHRLRGPHTRYAGHA